MSLPPGFVEDLQSRLSIAQVVGRKVMWDTRKSNQAKGDLWAPCPFHHEKTASFHVDDRKGFYYCFGCHAKGDAIKFVRETENMGFIDAVKLLAGEVGMEVPAADPRAQAKADRRTQLAEVMEQAVKFYRLQLKTGGASAAREYLVGRTIDDATLERFEIGFAPNARQGIWTHLREKGVEEQLIIDAGLCAKPDDGGAPYDRFRDRIMFPIRDGRGRAIAFGGRAMDPNARAKYMNSPETELFDKGRNLYNFGPARTAAGKGQGLIVAEGYMDVIALARAGFEGAVAPLGTAVTPEQLQLMWRVHPEPVIALDGDTAGIRAANRLIDLALPMLGAEQALRFVVLPEGKDPDDVIRTEGRTRMDEIIQSARPLISLLWQRETEGKVLDSPERRAALDKSLREALKKISDPSLRAHYGDEIKRMRMDLFSPARTGQREWRKGARSKKPVPTSGARNSLLAKASDAEARLREAVIVATLLVHPDLVEEFERPLEMADFQAPDLRAIVGELMRFGPVEGLVDKIADNLGHQTLENLFALRHVTIAPGVRRRDDIEAARTCLVEEFAKLDARRGQAREVNDAIEDLTGVADEGLTWRLAQAAEARNRADRSESKDTAEYDIASTGARLDRTERESFNNLMAQITGKKEDGEG